MGDLLSIYRTPAPLVRDVRRGEFEACPACGESFTIEKTVCEFCSGDKFDDAMFSVNMRNVGMHMRCATRSCPGYVKSDPYKRLVLFNVSPVYCGPGQRLVVSRFLFFWRRRCEEPGAHLHQRCGRCGWRGIVLPATDDA